MYSFVHNKSQNRLSVKKAESLVYLYTNSRILHQKLGADPLRWYDANVHSEDSNPDALGPVPAGEPNCVFDAMLAQHLQDEDREVNRAPPTYHAHRNLWRQGADHLEEVRNYYKLDEDELDAMKPDRWNPIPR